MLQGQVFRRRPVTQTRAQTVPALIQAQTIASPSRNRTATRMMKTERNPAAAKAKVKVVRTETRVPMTRATTKWVKRCMSGNPHPVIYLLLHLTLRLHPYPDLRPPTPLQTPTTPPPTRRLTRLLLLPSKQYKYPTQVMSCRGRIILAIRPTLVRLKIRRLTNFQGQVDQDQVRAPANTGRQLRQFLTVR